MTDVYEERSYAQVPIGFGHKPGIVVVDYQVGFTDSQYPLGGAPLVMRGVENTHRRLVSKNSNASWVRDAVIGPRRATTFGAIPDSAATRLDMRAGGTAPCGAAPACPVNGVDCPTLSVVV